jgi:hypothetical protein
MRYDEDTLEVVELGVASEVTQGAQGTGLEPGGKRQAMGIEDHD